MQKTKTKLIANVVILVLLLAITALFAACGNDNENTVKSGADIFGRTYGETYDIDDHDSGEYRLSYTIEDTSAMGKTMISNYCADHVLLQVADGEYFLTFYCKSDMLSDVTLGSDENKTEGESSVSDGSYGYKFAIERDTLDDKIAMSCTVRMMGRTVSFSIRLDLDKAVLVG